MSPSRRPKILAPKNRLSKRQRLISARPSDVFVLKKLLPMLAEVRRMILTLLACGVV